MRRRAATPDTGMHRPTPADIAELCVIASVAGAPLNAAALAFLASDQRAFGIGYDGRLWVNGTTAVTTYNRAQLYPALWHRWRVAVSLGEVAAH